MALKTLVLGIIFEVRFAPNQILGGNVGRLSSQARLTQE
jgi:hypothetical protein